MTLENFYFSSLRQIERFLSGPNWVIKLTLCSVALSLFLSFPPYHLLFDHLSGKGHLDAWFFIQNQGENLLAPKEMEADVRRENMIFRWTLPALSFLTGHNVAAIVILQAFLGLAFIYFTAQFAFELTGSKISTALFTVSVAHIFVGVWQFAEIHGYGDGIAYFCLLVAMLHRSPAVSGSMLLIAYFTDERALMAGGLIVLWNIARTAFDTGRFDLKHLVAIAFSHRNLLVWGTWIVYFAIRLTIGKIYFSDHQYSTMGTPVLFEQAHRNGLGSSIWGVFEGFWILILASAVVLWDKEKRYLSLLLIAGFGALLLSGLFVHDIDRSLSYGFPVLFLVFFLLYRNASERTFHLLLFFCAVICVLHPQVFYMGYNRILWLEPLPIKALQLLDRLSGSHFFS